MIKYVKTVIISLPFLIILTILISVYLVNKTQDNDINVIINGLTNCQADNECSDILKYVSLDKEKIELSYRDESDIYGPEQYSDFIDKLVELGALWEGDNIEVIQQKVITTGDNARVILNFKVERNGGSSYQVPLKIELKKYDGQWIIKKLRVMS